jgi:hypothetical protein
MTRFFHRYPPPTPAKDLLAEFWKLDKAAENKLKGLRNYRISSTRTPGVSSTSWRSP